jgi:chorismate mutase/prephenate dehydratase
MSIKIGYQGLIGCNAFKALINNFQNYTPINFENINVMINSLINKDIDCFILPLYNSISGQIEEHCNYITQYQNLKIIKIIPLNIEHTLYGLKESNLNNIKKIVSHKQALLQCSNFISNYKTLEFWNTIASMEYILNKNDNTIACIAPLDLNNNDKNIKILKTKISNENNNITYFYLFTVSCQI